MALIHGRDKIKVISAINPIVQKSQKSQEFQKSQKSQTLLTAAPNRSATTDRPPASTQLPLKPLHIPRWYRLPKGMGGILISAGIAAIASITWIGFRHLQWNRIQQAQTALTQACLANLENRDTLLTASRQINTAIQLLQTIPAIPGIGHEAAQTELLNSTQCIQRVQSAASLAQAETLGQAAMAITANTVLPATTWQTLQTDVGQAIALLETIPPSRPEATTAQPWLTRYQAQAVLIDTRFQAEAQAIADQAQAIALQQQADEQLQKLAQTAASDAESFSSESWLEAATQYQEAVRRFLQILQQQWQTQILPPLMDEFLGFDAAINQQIQYEEYAQRLKQLQDQFNQKTQAGTISFQHPVIPALADVLTTYEDAKVVWRYCHESNCYNSFRAGFLLDPSNQLWLPAAANVQGKQLIGTYSVAPRYSMLQYQDLVPLEPLLAEIWQNADQKMQAVNQRINP
ncbi:MAG: hypothetical protein MUF49_13850 [Oculatellaceae cyanobacterium Prado106]|nr:hypothetical protein [Oculatellaceae cyanobacterium Prado106]